MGRLKTYKNSAFTLTEILVVMVIIGILLTFAIPSYYTSIEKNRGQNAEFTLISIYNAQKRFKLANGAYYACAGVGTSCNATELEDNLGIYLSDPYFTYTMTANATNFTATANRTDGARCQNQEMNITQAGSDVIKGCDIW